ncbi:MAG TPA: helix-turn-helix domain-containing protein [Lachnospiraceae bacterium]|nr:helix-turn-helix domain-containing protein [Lachnospiraceae bacterium]
MNVRSDLPVCPVEVAIAMIGDKWKFLILRELVRDGTISKRFTEIKRGIDGISDKMLSQNLRIMEEHSLIKREVFNEKPPKVEYSLTDLGRTLVPVLRSLNDWGIMYQETLKEKK